MTPASGPDAAAAANWFWLTGLDRAAAALVVGPADDAHAQMLGLHAGHVVSLDQDAVATPARLDALPDQAFEYVAFPDVGRHQSQSTAALCGRAGRLLRPAGWLALAGRRGERPPRLHHALRSAGFNEIHPYLLAPDHSRPAMVIPATRRAVLACELDGRRQRGGNRLRIAAAAAGACALLFGGWLWLAQR